MSETPDDRQPESAHTSSSEPSTSSSSDEMDAGPAVTLPGWVPIAIALTLIVMASLAVYTGLNYRARTLKQRELAQAPVASTTTRAPGHGELQPGASRMVGEQFGDAVPTPNAATANEGSAVEITGDAKTISQTIRMKARGGMMLKIQPDEAVVYVNNQPIGQARQFASADQVYEFADAGSFTVRIVAPGFRDLTYVVTTDTAAPEQYATIEASMELN